MAQSLKYSPELLTCRKSAYKVAMRRYRRHERRAMRAALRSFDLRIEAEQFDEFMS